MLVSVEASAACTIQLVKTAKGGVGNGSVAVVGGWRHVSTGKQSWNTVGIPAKRLRLKVILACVSRPAAKSFPESRAETRVDSRPAASSSPKPGAQGGL